MNTQHQIKNVLNESDYQEIITKHEKALHNAQTLYGELPKCEIQFSKKMIRFLVLYKFNKKKNIHLIVYSIAQINTCKLRFDEAILGEIAHFVWKAKGLDKNHDWKKIYQLLGGSVDITRPINNVLNETDRQEIITKHEKVMQNAKTLYGELPKCEIKFSKIMIRSLGYYKCIKIINMHQIVYSIDWINRCKWTVINNTIPHEIAHFVCQIKGFGQNHNSGWKKICKSLGGSGEICSVEEDIESNSSIPSISK